MLHIIIEFGMQNYFFIKQKPSNVFQIEYTKKDISIFALCQKLFLSIGIALNS